MLQCFYFRTILPNSRVGSSPCPLFFRRCVPPPRPMPHSWRSKMRRRAARHWWDWAVLGCTWVSRRGLIHVQAILFAHGYFDIWQSVALARPIDLLLLFTIYNQIWTSISLFWIPLMQNMGSERYRQWAGFARNVCMAEISFTFLTLWLWMPGLAGETFSWV